VNKNFILETKGSRTFVQTAGRGRPIVFIHGALLNSDLWQRQFETLSHRYQCIAYDLRGHGRSGKTPIKRYSAALFARDLLAILDALRIEKPILCGLSLGGMIAQTFAARYPHRVRGLILCNTAISTRYHLSDRLIGEFVGIVTPSAVNLLGTKRLRFFTQFMNGHRKWMSQTEDGVQFAEKAIAMIEPAEVVKIINAVRTFHSVFLRRPAIPVLMINGEEDSPLILRQATILQRVYPGSRYVLIPGAGHLSNIDKPGVFHTAVSEFVKNEGLFAEPAVTFFFFGRRFSVPRLLDLTPRRNEKISRQGAKTRENLTPRRQDAKRDLTPRRKEEHAKTQENLTQRRQVAKVSKGVSLGNAIVPCGLWAWVTTAKQDFGVSSTERFTLSTTDPATLFRFLTWRLGVRSVLASWREIFPRLCVFLFASLKKKAQP
jgi:pimeloyl-ACP methyl ester carboxylesterase